MTLGHHRVTHREVVYTTVVVMALLLLIEACAAFHFYVIQRDVYSAAIVFTAWGKDLLVKVIKYIGVT